MTRTDPAAPASGPATTTTPRTATPTTALVAGGSLVVGFAVAQATDVRALGGAVLVAGAAWCGRRWVRRRGALVAAGLVTAYVGAFVGSHLLAPRVGAWPAVLTVSAAVAALSWVVADRHDRA